MKGQAYKLMNNWWVKYQKDIVYREDLVMNRSAWCPVRDNKIILGDGDWVEFSLKKTKVGSVLSGPVYEEYAVIRKVI